MIHGWLHISPSVLLDETLFQPLFCVVFPSTTQTPILRWSSQLVFPYVLHLTTSLGDHWVDKGNFSCKRRSNRLIYKHTVNTLYIGGGGGIIQDLKSHYRHGREADPEIPGMFLFYPLHLNKEPIKCIFEATIITHRLTNYVPKTNYWIQW